jgi:hypothetical protein
MALTVTMLKTLEDRFPGFKAEVRERLERSAEQMEQSDDADSNADAPSIRELLSSWVFTGE